MGTRVNFASHISNLEKNGNSQSKQQRWFDRIACGQGRVIHFSLWIYPVAQRAQPRHILGFQGEDIVLSIFYLKNTTQRRSTTEILENGMQKTYNSYMHNNLMSPSSKCWTVLKLLKLVKGRIQNTTQTEI